MRYEILCRHIIRSGEPQRLCIVDFEDRFHPEQSDDIIKDMVEAMEGIGDCTFEFKELVSIPTIKK